MTEKDRISAQWDAAAESWVDFVRQGKDYYRDELNNPAFFSLLGSIDGQLVLDLACGEGYNTRKLARKGAVVTGVDFSQRLIDLAKTEEAKDRLNIDYHLSDAARLKEFYADHFDLVTCFMALQDIENYEKAISEVCRVLKAKGRFVFSITQTSFVIIVEDGNRISTNVKYFGVAEDHIYWKMERLLKPFETTSFHRTLTDYSRVLHDNGFLIKRLVEPRPTRKGLKKHPPLRQVLLRPHSIIIECQKE
jgi:2-polyprenyl-3-methyl-5-hydroxy-6-metoxy-1,4-benzoquinol methylase